MSRLTYAERILEENEINLGAAASRIMDTDGLRVDQDGSPKRVAPSRRIDGDAGKRSEQRRPQPSAIRRAKTNSLTLSNRTNNQATT